MDSEKIKDAVNSIEMSKAMEDRVKENCNILERKKSGQVHYKRWISVACAFGILLLIIGIQFFNKNGSFQVANFTITAYALSDDGNQLNTTITSEKATIELGTEDRIGAMTSVSGGGNNWIFTNIMLNIIGEQIDSITYTLSEGKFIEDVILTAKEHADRDWLLSEKIYMTLSEPGSDLFQGIKEIGNTYTVNYNEQDQYKYTLAIPHDGNGVIDDDIIIKVIVKYKDGNSEQQNILVTQEADSISLKLN